MARWISNCMRFSYHHAGHCGVPIVLQQCWPETPWAWRRVTLLLSPVCDVTVPDLPSFAYSSMSENGFDKKTITPRLKEFLQALGPPASCSPATIWVGTPPTPHTGWKKSVTLLSSKAVCPVLVRKKQWMSERAEAGTSV